MACPFTKGSLGSLISRGTISVDEGVLDEVVSDARVFDRGRKGDECVGVVGAGCDGERAGEVSDAADWDRPEMGTIRFWIFWEEVCADSGDRGLVNSSWGISSAAGMGRPLPAATS
jgi:hypothetical protein